VLVGPEVMSSAEAFALMFEAAPGCTLVGERTAGSTGNPRALELVGGVTARVPRWLAAAPDGTPIEGHGVVPKLRFDAPADPDRDPILDPLLESLR
jgi:C-terminal processing protease CtpA/Prc